MRAGSNLPLVAIVGRPNVGKSTLYNRIVGGRQALVEDKPGVTRDRRYGVTEWDGRRLEIVDTGGLDPTAEIGVIQAGIHRQASRALDEADLVVFVIDAKEGLTSVDREIAKKLRRLDAPVLVVANKVDGEAQELLANEAYALGLGEVLSVSATHGRGAGELMDELLAKLPDAPRAADLDAEEESWENDEGAAEAAGEGGGKQRDAFTPKAVRLTFVGRPNAGKSSLVNRILGEERVLVHDQPGTTTDPVDTPFSFDGQDFVLVDTAGIRKKARVDDQTEKVSVSMALESIRRSHVCVLVLDATSPPGDQDAKIAGEIEASGRGVIILANKADALGSGPKAAAGEERVRTAIKELMPFLPYAPVRFVSAKTGAGVTAALGLAAKVHKEHRKRIGTSELNRFFEEVCETHPPPTFRSKPVRIYYITQPQAGPPTFILWASKPELVHQAYRRFLANQLRTRFGFEGTPLRIVVRARNPKKERR